MADLTAMLQAAAGNAGGDANFIEDMFSCFLYTGTGAAQTITNGIDLAGEGGLVWIKGRNSTNQHELMDSERSNFNNSLISNSTAAQRTDGATAVSALATGFQTTGGNHNVSGRNYVSWTFRKQPKFFDVVTYTGNGAASRQIPHDLGSAPGCMIVKGISIAEGWTVYHRSEGATKFGLIDQTDAFGTSSDRWNNTEPTSTVFTVGNAAKVNASGQTYVAYLFAHDAGGFGLTGTDNVISCGSVVGASQVEVYLGYEPQWILVKNASSAQDWWLVDNMRGLPVQGTDTSYNASNLRPNLSDAETTGFAIAPSATGFKANVMTSGQTYIYIAIRRGPMKVPETGTSVFSPTTNAGTGSNKTITTNFPVDLTINSSLSAATHVFTDRLRGGGVDVSPRLFSQFTDAETNTSGGRGILFDNNTGFTLTSNYSNGVGGNYIYYGMRRAPGFFDEVCYTGTGSAGVQIPHNLGVAPELLIVKPRNQDGSWRSYAAPLGPTKYISLNESDAAATLSAFWNDTAPTATVFTLGSSNLNNSGIPYVAYLFATVPGVSKVGSYTGTGTTQTINCGFTAGSRFIMIKRTDSTGNWYVWDSARGIVAGNDPYLLLNSTAAEVTNTDFIDPAATGFEISSTAPAEINASGGSFIFLAVA